MSITAWLFVPFSTTMSIPNKERFCKINIKKSNKITAGLPPTSTKTPKDKI